MSGTIQSLHRKINGAADLEGVVRAMKALAASSIGQYERAVQSLEEYYRTVELGLTACLLGAAVIEEAMPAKVGVAIGAIVFGSDQGLVGQFNDVVVNQAIDTLNKLAGPKRKIWVVGERAFGLLVDSSLPVPTRLSVPSSVREITPLVGEILVEVEKAREQHNIEEVYLFHNRPESGSLYQPVCGRLLPLDQAWRNKFEKLPWPAKMLPEVIEGPLPTMKAFISGYLFVLLFQACAESLNSENASRLAAMQRAEKNIKDILEDLKRELNHVRQGSIDEELFDVVSGFEALKSHDEH